MMRGNSRIEQRAHLIEQLFHIERDLDALADIAGIRAISDFAAA